MSDACLEENLRRYKCYEKGENLHLIPIYQEERMIGYLRPLTFDYRDSLPGIISMLSRWRRENPTAGAGTFEVTDERTENWLNKFVLENRRRIIFVIVDLNYRCIGHIGLAQFDCERRCADIDAVLRGEKDILPGIMSAALEAIIQWGKRDLDLVDFYLDVFNDNTHAIRFYEKNRFVEMQRIALVKVIYEDEEKWEFDEELDPKYAERCYIRMKYVGE